MAEQVSSFSALASYTQRDSATTAREVILVANSARSYDERTDRARPISATTRPQASRGWVMSLDAKRTYIVPDQTAQVARAIFPKGNPVMRLYDDLPMVVADRDFADLFPARGGPLRRRSGSRSRHSYSSWRG